MKSLILVALLGLLASPAIAQSNTASTSATGNDNTETITQTGSANEALSAVLGDDNVTFITQIGAGNTAQPDGGLGINVEGDGNDLSIRQEGGGNWAGISAVGMNNNNVPDQSDDNVATIEQVGDDQRANFKIRGSGNGTGAAGLMRSVQTGGDSNRMNVSVDGDLNGVDLLQDGGGNLATVDIDAIDGQTLSTNNSVDIDQIGDGNKVGDGLFGAPRGVMITGNNNTVDIDQLGDGNAVLVAQDGDSNVATIEQYGVGSHEAYVKMSDGASLDVFQNGEGNDLMGLGGVGAAQVLGGSSLTVDQIGDFNKAYVNQQNGDVGVITQNGSNNVATINQN